MPAAVGFVTKPKIALEQIRAACEAKIPSGIVLMDAGYGADAELRTQITELGLKYSAGIQQRTSAWPQGKGPLPPKTWPRHWRPTSQTPASPIPSRSRRALGWRGRMLHSAQKYITSKNEQEYKNSASGAKLPVAAVPVRIGGGARSWAAAKDSPWPQQEKTSRPL